MKECSLGKQVFWAITSTVVAYVLLVLFIRYSTETMNTLFKGTSLFSSLVAYIALYIIIILFPVIISKSHTNFNILILFFDPIITFVMTMLYCPDGWYFLVWKKNSDGFSNGVSEFQSRFSITIMMFIMHLIAFGMGKIILYFKSEKNAKIENTDIQT